MVLAAGSGAAALAWQGLWTVHLAASLGHEWSATLGVVAGLFAGMALGAAVLSPRVARAGRAGWWFAALELVSGLWGMLLSVLIPTALPLLAPWLGESPSPIAHAALALALPLILMLPSTIAMGATWPALSRAVNAHHASMAPLYAVNTAGALVGVLGSVFWLVPNLGLQRGAVVVAAINLMCAVSAAACFRHRIQIAADRSRNPIMARSHRAALLALAAMGLLGIGYEVLCIRVLSQVGENTVYSFAVMVSVFLLGTAAGAAWRLPRSNPAQAVLMTGTAVALGGLCLWGAADLASWGHLLGQRWGVGGLAAEGIVAVCALLLPAVAMGATFTLLCGAALEKGCDLGQALASNLLGAGIAPVVIGATAIPLWGTAATLCSLLAGYGAVAVVAGYRIKPASRMAWPAAVAALIAVAALAWVQPLRPLDLQPDEHVVSEVEGPMAAVVVTAGGDGILRLRINNRVQEGSSAASPVEARLALLPLLLHPQPRNLLLLGWGTGYTARVAALDDRLQVQAVELLPEVIRASALFDTVPSFPATRDRVNVLQADARRFALASSQRFDLIVADLFHPARNGAGSLYTVEHYRALRDRLAPGGLVCQWVALYQMELATLRSVAAAFREVFPDAIVILASNSLDTPVIGLVARRDLPLASAQEVAHRLAQVSSGLRPQLQRTGLVDTHAVLGSTLMGGARLQAWLGTAVANRDDRPVVTYSAPWDTYDPQTTPAQRLGVLLAQAGDPDLKLLGAELGWDAHLAQGNVSPSAQELATLRNYMAARNHYLALGLNRPDLRSTQVRQDLASSLQELLDLSPQFRPAADALRVLRPDSLLHLPASLTP